MSFNNSSVTLCKALYVHAHTHTHIPYIQVSSLHACSLTAYYLCRYIQSMFVCTSNDYVHIGSTCTTPLTHTVLNRSTLSVSWLRVVDTSHTHTHTHTHTQCKEYLHNSANSQSPASFNLVCTYIHIYIHTHTHTYTHAQCKQYLHHSAHPHSPQSFNFVC